MPDNKRSRFRLLMQLGCVGICAILAFWAQGKVCVYWLPNEGSIQNAEWLTPNLIRFNESRIIDWRLGRAWLDPCPNIVRFALPHDSRYFVEVHVLVGAEDFFTSNLTGTNRFPVLYRDAQTSQVQQQFSLEIESSLQPIDAKRCYIVPSMNAISDHIVIIEFPESGPRMRRIQLPSTTEVLRRRGFRLLDEDRLLSWYYDEEVRSDLQAAKWTPVWKMELFRIDGDDATRINDWQSSSIEYLYTDTNHITTVKPGNTTIEVRNRDGEIERVLEKSWPWLVPPNGDDEEEEPPAKFSNQGYIAWASEATASPKYWDAVTLQPLLADRPYERIRHYHQSSGRIVTLLDQSLEVSWRDMDQPPKSIPLSSSMEPNLLSVNDSLLVACQPYDSLLFQIVDLNSGTVSDFDYRPRRTFWIWTTALLAFFACGLWCWLSWQQKWPVGLDWCVLASGLFSLHLYSAWLLRASIVELESLHWSAVTIAGILLSSWWLIFGFRSIAFRLAVHLALFASLSFGLTHLDLGFVDSTLLLFSGFAPIIFLILGLGMFRLQYPPGSSNPPSSRTRIIDLLFLTAALAAILARIRGLISPEQGGLSGISEIWSEMESVGLEMWEFGLLTVVCLGLSVIVLTQWSSRRFWVSLAIHAVVFVTLLGMWWYVRYNEVYSSVMLIVLSFAFLMFLFRIRGWRFVWRWKAINASR